MGKLGDGCLVSPLTEVPSGNFLKVLRSGLSSAKGLKMKIIAKKNWGFHSFLIYTPMWDESTLPKKYKFLLYFEFIKVTSFTFSVLAIWNWLSCKLKATRDKSWHMVMEEQNFDHDNSIQKNFSENIVNVHREKTYKCNQCNFASVQADNLKRHLKTHSGEKSNKCKQCDYASSHASDLRRHMKSHSENESNKCKQCDYASS